MRKTGLKVLSDYRLTSEDRRTSQAVEYDSAAATPKIRGGPPHGPGPVLAATCTFSQYASPPSNEDNIFYLVVTRHPLSITKLGTSDRPGASASDVSPTPVQYNLALVRDLCYAMETLGTSKPRRKKGEKKNFDKKTRF